jgi:hypothetical protein
MNYLRGLARAFCFRLCEPRSFLEVLYGFKIHRSEILQWNSMREMTSLLTSCLEGKDGILL